MSRRQPKTEAEKEKLNRELWYDSIARLVLSQTLRAWDNETEPYFNAGLKIDDLDIIITCPSVTVKRK